MPEDGQELTLRAAFRLLAQITFRKSLATATTRLARWRTSVRAGRAARQEVVPMAATLFVTTAHRMPGVALTVAGRYAERWIKREWASSGAAMT